ncbi:MAG TPA: magnesium transporter [Symbiobacteriaceae bacterium]|nr:magnesium transporter [Symbiobacteriaceae bacterium]
MNQELLGLLDQIYVLLEQRRLDELKELLASLQPADLAELLEELEDKDRASVVHLLSDEAAAETISELDTEDQVSILTSVGTERAGDILEEMSADDVADLVGELTPQQAGVLLDLLDSEDATDVRELLGYRPDSAGGIMTTEVVALKQDTTAQEAIDELRRLAPEVETAYYVYVVNDRDQLVGVLSLRELIIASPETPIKQIMRTKLITVHADEDQEQVAQEVKRYNIMAVPVVDDNQVLLGIVTVDDVIDVLEEEATEDIYRAAGVSHDEQDADPGGAIWRSVKSRLPWLMGLLFLSLVTGKVIEHFNWLLTSVAALQVFITTMAGGAGNAATQALTVAVRGLATGEIEREQIWQIVWRELKIGGTIGIICGVTLGLTAGLWHHSFWIGLIVALAILVNLTLAKATGTIVPVMLQSFGMDPAVASGPFIATVADTSSMLVYLGIAATLFRYLV